MPSTASLPGLIIALDGLDTVQALGLAHQLPPDDCRLKVGSELFVKGGPGLVTALQHDGFEVFLDLKFHDIPNTVSAALSAARELGVWMCTVHASGGPAMLEAAREAADSRVHTVAVTVLTSLDDADLEAVGQTDAKAQALRLARLAHSSGLSGIVCSAQEAASIREEMGEDFLIVTPGIRLEAASDDQKRVTTPLMAAKAGSNYLVVGRPIAAAKDPRAALEEFLHARSVN